MNFCVFLFLLFLTSDNQRSDLQYFIATGFESRNGVRDYFREFPPEEIEKLKFHDNLKVSIFAAWIHCRISCLKLTEPNGTDSLHFRGAFLDFSEGRLNTKIPTWWRTQINLQSAEANSGGIPSSHIAAKEVTLTEGVCHNNSIKISLLSDDHFAGSREGRDFFIEWDREDVYGNGRFLLNEPILAADVVFVLSNDQYVYAIADNISTLIVCCNARNQILWKAIVDTMDQQGMAGLTPETREHIEIRVSNGRVHLFGANSSAVYLSSFELETGNKIVGFTTNFYLDSLHK